MISGGPIDDAWMLRGGWALQMFGNGRRAHFFNEDLVAVCGVDVVPHVHIGDWSACQRCVAKRGAPSIQEREAGRNIEAERMLLAEIERNRCGGSGA